MKNNSQGEEEPAGRRDRALRAIDANANRAAEALRVVEDYLRFVLEDRGLTNTCKEARHQLAAAIQAMSRPAWPMRAVDGDVGREMTAVDEYRRTDGADIAAANFARAQQSLRSLEEFTKLTDAAVASRFETLRYDIYSLERAVCSTVASRKRLADTHVYVLLAGGESESEFEQAARAAIQVGADAIQLRDKTLADRELIGRARILRRLSRGTDCLFIMNDRADIAAVVAADGVHVGQDDLSPAEARAVVGAESLIGVSTHSIEQARRAVADGADYIGCGPTFASRTKKFANFPGPDFLCQVAAEITLPAFAIGGVGPENLDQVISAGLTRVAISAAAPDVAEMRARLTA